MKIKRFTLLTLPALVLVVGAIVLIGSKDAHYFPRKSQMESTSASNGYMEYISSIKANKSTGTVDLEDVYAAMKQADMLPKSKAALNVNWTSIGPDNVGGRTRAIAIDRNNPDHIIAGSVTGGIYESFDGAKTWEAYDPSFSVANISSITQAIDGSFYVGTGGHFEFPDNKTRRNRFFIGTGVYKLTGNGNFQLIKGPSNRNNVAYDYATIGKVVASPTDANKLYVAMNKGFKILTLDANGSVLSETDPIARNQACNDIEVSESGKVVVSYEGKIYVSQSGDANFVETTPPLIYGSYPGFEYGRIETAIAPSDDNIMYAAVAAKWAGVNPSNLPPVGNNCLAAVFRSQDSGNNWEIIRQGAPNVDDIYLPLDGLGCSGNWSNTLAVFPDDPGKIIVGGAGLYRWEQSSVDPNPSNGSWNRIDYPFEFNSSGDPFPNYVHSGKHSIVWDPRDSDVAYIATNGGITKTKDFNAAIPTYRTHNYLYNTTQYYGIAVNANGIVMGGSQDNGTHILNLKGAAGNPAYQVMGNNVMRGDDGFDAELSNINPALGFASSFHNRIRRIQGIGTTPGNSNFSTADIFNTNSWLGGLCRSVEGCSPVFYSTTTYWESFNHEGSTDSVELLFESFQLPPLDSGTVFTFEGNNNKYPQKDSIQQDIHPIDTISGASGAMDTFLLANSTNVIANFDTLVVDTVAKTITIGRRANTTPIILNYNYGDLLKYENGMLGASTVVTDSIIRIRVDTFKTGAATGQVFMEVEKGFIMFRYALKFQDKVQSMFATANWPGRGGQSGIDRSQKNIFMSRDLLKGKADVKWFMIGGAPSTPDAMSGDILDMKFSTDGNHLFVGTADFIGGRVYRISGIDDVKTFLAESGNNNLEDIINTVLAGRCHEIGFFPNQSVTAIDVDPNNADNVVVALGNYGSPSHIKRTTVGTTAMSSAGTFESIDGTGGNALPSAPAYSILIDKNDNNKVLIGTDLGVFGTDNAFSATASAVSWTEENGGMGRVPAFDLKQMRLDYTKASNDGKIYVGTHGRGAYVSDIFVGLSKNSRGDDNEDKSFKNSLNLYPNPVSTHATLSLKINDPSEALTVQLFNIRGQVVKSIRLDGLTNGENKLMLNLQDLDRGTYILRAIQKSNIATTKFIKH